MKSSEMKGMTVAAAVSGGLDSCTVTRWLSDRGVKVLCCTVDLGQPDEPDLEAVKKRMMESGAMDAIVIDGKDALAKAGCLAIQAQALYEGEYWNTTGIARYVTTSLIVEEMKKRGISIFVHGATGRGNDQVRFQLITNMLEPSFQVYAPWRDESFLKDFGGRTEMINYCAERGIPIKQSHQKPYSTDANLLGLTHEAGNLESLNIPADFVKPEMGKLPIDAPDKKELFEISFLKGFPALIGNKQVSYLEAFQIANEIGGQNGIGIARHLVENRFVGIKSRGVYEMPGIVLLGKCYDYLLEMVLDRRAMKLFRLLSSFIGEQIYQGYWFDPGSRAAMNAIQCFGDMASGTIKVSLYKGQISYESSGDVLHNLYSEEDASMEKIGSFDHADSEGLLRILGVSAKNLSVRGQIDIAWMNGK